MTWIKNIKEVPKRIEEGIKALEAVGGKWGEANHFTTLRAMLFALRDPKALSFGSFAVTDENLRFRKD